MSKNGVELRVIEIIAALAAGVACARTVSIPTLVTQGTYALGMLGLYTLAKAGANACSIPDDNEMIDSPVVGPVPTRSKRRPSS